MIKTLNSMDKYKILPKDIQRYNVESLSDKEQTEFWECFENNAPIEYFNLQTLDYKLVISFDQDSCFARYCLFDNDAFDYNNFLFETDAKSLDELAKQINRCLDVLKEAGYLSEQCFWITEKLGLVGKDLPDHH